MGNPYPDLNPYESLGVKLDANYTEIKKAYKRLSLKYHPDKIQQSSRSNEDINAFPRIQFAYSILSEPLTRQRYDSTGSLDIYDDDDGAFDWMEYFRSMNDKITIDMIEEDRTKYQKSSEEKSDILNEFIYYEGDVLKLFEVIPHLEFDETQEDRVFRIIEEAMGEQSYISKLDQTTIDSWQKYKRSRKTKVRQMLKKLAKEAKEAEKLEKELNLKRKHPINTENNLKAIIQSKNSQGLDDLILKLESKYVNKRGKKRANREISDDEFNRIQKKTQ